jgi:hypothetical protein
MGADFDYWELPRDLFRRGRRPKWVRRLEASYWKTMPPAEIDEILRRREQGETIPQIARALGWSVRKVQTALQRTRGPKLRWESVSAVAGTVQVCVDGKPPVPVIIFELVCSSCGQTVYHTAAVPRDELPSFAQRYEFGFHCPYCKRWRRAHPQEWRRLPPAMLDEWRKTRRHEDRQRLFFG